MAENVPAIRQYLEKYESKIVAALPETAGITATRMASIVMQETRRMPGLLKCNPLSLFGAVVQCAQLGLEPGAVLRQAYLIPYGNECQLIIGYAGMIALASRSGKVANIQPRAVFEGDTFDYAFGLGERLNHIPMGNSDADKLTHAYCIVTMTDGTKTFDVMTRDEVDKIRSRSKSGNRGPWVTDYIPMALKTVIRRAFKYLPVSVEMQRASSLDEMADAGVAQQLSSVIDADPTDYEDITEEAPSSSAEELARAAQEAAQPDPDEGA